MKVLVACEKSGEVRRAFAALGHFARSCDLEPADDGSPDHYQDDAVEVVRFHAVHGGWADLLIAHPPCTYLSVSGLHWNKRRPERAALTVKAIEFARALWESNVPKIALENPIGCLPTLGGFGRATQIIQPHQFGADASKATCLWLKGLPKLKATQNIAPRLVDGRPRWANSNRQRTEPAWAFARARGSSGQDVSRHRGGDGFSVGRPMTPGDELRAVRLLLEQTTKDLASALELLKRSEAEAVKLKMERDTARAVLRNIRDYVAERCDMDPGRNGGEDRPNWAMQFDGEFCDDIALVLR